MRREKKDQILAVLPEKIRGILLNHGLDFEKIQEIRLREEQPLAVKKEGKEELFTHRVTKEELRETMEYVSNYSLYAYENELRQGFLTIEGGHRVGISGKIISEKEQIRNFQYITSINIRICHEITGCANKLFPVILEKWKTLPYHDHFPTRWRKDYTFAGSGAADFGWEPLGGRKKCGCGG